MTHEERAHRYLHLNFAEYPVASIADLAAAFAEIEREAIQRCIDVAEKIKLAHVAEGNNIAACITDDVEFALRALIAKPEEQNMVALTESKSFIKAEVKQISFEQNVCDKLVYRAITNAVDLFKNLVFDELEVEITVRIKR